jgi:hypothetical protein
MISCCSALRGMLHLPKTNPTLVENKPAMRKVFKVLALFTPLIFAVLAGCGRNQDMADNRADPWGVVEVRRGSPIRIGVVTTFSEADMPDAHLELMRGAQLLNRGEHYRG